MSNIRWSNLRWPSNHFANLIGLDGPNHDSFPVVAEGRVDARTGGAVSISTEIKQGSEANTFSMLTDYVVTRPNQSTSKISLFDLEFSTAGGQEVALRNLWVCGRKVYDSDEAELNAPVATGQADGRLRNVNRVLAAVQQVNRTLREGELPEVARILKTCAVHEAVGEHLQVPGQKAEGGFDFDPLPRTPERLTRKPRTSTAQPHLTLPTAVARALMGLDANNIDSHQQIGPRRSTTVIDPQNGLSFAAHMQVAEGPAQTFRTLVQIQPLLNPQDVTAFAIPDLMSSEWQAGKNGQLELKKMSVLGVDLAKADRVTQMRAVGVHNRILHDFRARRYSPVLDHLAAFDMLELAEQDHLPPTRPKAGWLRRVSLGGEAMEEIAEGYGGSLSGFCKLIFHERMNKHGLLDRVGVCHDLGAYMSNEPNKGAVGNLLPYLDDIKLILLTHPHIDHYAGLPIYVAAGLLKRKDVAASPKVIRLLRRQLKTFPGAKDETLWPNFIPIKGRGWFHLQDDDGVERLSVGYAQDATPHSARTTPFIYVGRYGSEVAGTYLNHSDARYGRHNAEGYKGPSPKVDWLDRDFFQNWGRDLSANDASITPAIVGARPSLFEVDATSVTKKGWSPTNLEAEGNVQRFKGWFADKGLIVAQLSGSENSHESHLRVASRVRADVTEFGANLEHAATDMNVLGVNRLQLKPAERGNIQLFLDDEFKSELEDAQKALAKKAKRPLRIGESRVLETQQKCLEARLAAQAELAGMKNPFKRHARRTVLEEELAAQFGPGHEVALGSIRVSRTTRTARAIFNGNPARRLTLVTGTQNTLAEVDAVLVRLSEGRSLFDARPEHRHTARPLGPKTDVVLIAQSAIPGNNASQREMIDRLTDRGYTVGVAVHDGLDLHNLSANRRKAILQDLEQSKTAYQIKPDGTLHVSEFPVYAPGHGYEEDIKAKLKLVNAHIASPNHTVDPQGVKRFCALAQDIGQDTPGRNFRVFEQVFIQHNPETQAAPQVFGHGRSWESLITYEIKRKARQYYGGHVEAAQVTKIDQQSGIQQNGLMAALEQGGTYYASLALAPEAKPPAKPVDLSQAVLPIAFNRVAPVPERKLAEPKRPGEKQRMLNLQPRRVA